MNRIIEWLANWLDPSERDAVLGDLTEAGTINARAIRALLGLIARRHWQIWIALSCLMCTVGLALSPIVFRFGGALGGQLRTYAKYGVLQETGLTFDRQVVYLSCLLLAIPVWMWATGFLIGCLSGRAAWLTGSLFWIIFVDFWRVRVIVSGAVIYWGNPWSLLVPWNPEVVLFLAFALWGMNRGYRVRVPAVGTAVFLAAVTAVLTTMVFVTGGWKEAAVRAWSEGAIPGLPWESRLWPLVLASLPAAYILILARIRANRFRYDA